MSQYGGYSNIGVSGAGRGMMPAGVGVIPTAFRNDDPRTARPDAAEVTRRNLRVQALSLKNRIDQARGEASAFVYGGEPSPGSVGPSKTAGTLYGPAADPSAYSAAQAQRATQTLPTALPPSPAGVRSKMSVQQRREAAVRQRFASDVSGPSQNRNLLMPGETPDQFAYKQLEQIKGMRDSARAAFTKINAALMEATKRNDRIAIADLTAQKSAAQQEFVRLHKMLTGTAADQTPEERASAAQALSANYSMNRRVGAERATQAIKDAIASGDKEALARAKADLDHWMSIPEQFNPTFDKTPSDPLSPSSESGAALGMLRDQLAEGRRKEIIAKKQADEQTAFDAQMGTMGRDLTLATAGADIADAKTRVAVAEANRRKAERQNQPGGIGDVEARTEDVQNKRAMVEIQKQENPAYAGVVESLGSTFKRAAGQRDFSTTAGKRVRSEMETAYKEWLALPSPELRAEAARDIVKLIAGENIPQEIQLYSDNAIINALQTVWDSAGFFVSQIAGGDDPMTRNKLNAEAEGLYSAIMKAIIGQTKTRPR